MLVQGVHTAHVIIDGTIDAPRVRQFQSDPEKSLSPDAIGEEYYKLHTQHRSTWSQEIDLRPYQEKF